MKKVVALISIVIMFGFTLLTAAGTDENQRQKIPAKNGTPSTTKEVKKPVLQMLVMGENLDYNNPTVKKECEAFLTKCVYAAYQPQKPGEEEKKTQFLAKFDAPVLAVFDAYLPDKFENVNFKGQDGYFQLVAWHLYAGRDKNAFHIYNQNILQKPLDFSVQKVSLPVVLNRIMVHEKVVRQLLDSGKKHVAADIYQQVAKAIAKSPDYKTMRCPFAMMLARLHYSVGDLKEAIHRQKEAVKAAEKPETKAHLGKILDAWKLELKKKKEAGDPLDQLFFYRRIRSTHNPSQNCRRGGGG